MREHISLGRVLPALVALIGVVALVLVVTVGRPAETPPPPPPPKPRPVVEYVAMGSSFASGVGDGKSLDRHCARTEGSYPHRVAATAKDVDLRLTDVSCAGAHTQDLLTPDPEDPRVPPQVDALTPKTKLVTITVGGNDIAYVPRTGTAACANLWSGIAVSPSGPQCPRLVWPSPFPTPDRYAAVQQSLTQVLQTVRERAPQAQVLLVGYLPVASVNEPPCPLLPLEPWQVVETTQVGSKLDAASRAAADAVPGVTYLSMLTPGDAHTTCAQQSWIRGYGKPIPFHPNTAGNEAVAAAVVKALKLPV